MKLLHVFTLSGTALFFDGQFKFLEENGYEIVMVAQPVEGVDEFAKRNGIKFIPVGIPRSLSPLTIMKAIREITKIIRREHIEAVFGHTPVGALVAMISARLAGVKKRIYYRHGIIYSTMAGLKQRVFMAEEKFVSALATHIVNVSPSLAKKCVIDDINKAEKNIVIGKGTCGGIDAQCIFNPKLLDAYRLEEKRKRLGLSDADIVFGFCGRLCKDKGTPELIDAFIKFRQQHENLNVKLLLIGRLDERDILPTETKEYIKNDKDIILTGWVNVNEIKYYYSLLDCFIFPSHREGFGMCVIEASAMEVPILVAPSHGCIDSIEEGVSGYYIYHDPSSICEGMERMLDKDHMIKIGKQGRKFVLKHFDSKSMWPYVLDIYSRIFKD